MDLCDRNDIQTLLSRHGFHFSKSMGQNFLIEPWVPRDIAEASGAGPDTGVLEIGPGIGPLTVELAKRAGRVAAVELDQRLLPILAETLSDYPNTAVISGDVMKLDLKALVTTHFPGLTPLVCANLPYNITTPVLTLLLESGLFQTITVMIQKEVAERICAGPGKGDYGAFSVFCQYHAKTELLFEVPRDCFLPAPKVTSAVLRLTPQPPPACVHEEALFFRVVRGAFGLRRKTLLNALSAAFPLPKAELQRCLDQSGLPPEIRGERLGIEEFARLSDEISARLTR
ncbi:MAG: 16S rRNA (adenine(1518)-N(6)/adenine(1519)-N(6))-dimethyltransferase RsmA [Clostridiales bacterium]|nr:16S rRNA (adenine(1518)-N(6)/adenine(1519)-N(6))-dimethyltransferase RsmA [Clostridiales bacterium]